MTMGMPMEHLHIPIMQQGGGGGGAYEGMSAGGKNTPSGLVQANMAAGQQQRGMPSGTEVVHDAAAAVNPRAQQQYMAAVVARVPMARPQYITPMQNHGGRDGHMNYGGGKIRGGEQPQNTKQFVAQGGSNDASGLHVSVISSPLASGMTPMARPQYIGPMQKNSGEDGQVNYSRGKIKEGEQMQNTKQCVTPGVANDLPTVSVSGPLPGGTTPPKNVRSNMMGDSGFPDIDLMSGGPLTMQRGGGSGSTNLGMPAGGSNTPSGLVRAAMAAGNPMAQQQQGMPSGMEVLQDAAATVNPRAQQQYIERMQQQPLLVTRGIKKKMH
jgi:hypothetical protein